MYPKTISICTLNFNRRFFLIRIIFKVHTSTKMNVILVSKSLKVTSAFRSPLSEKGLLPKTLHSPAENLRTH